MERRKLRSGLLTLALLGLWQAGCSSGATSALGLSPAQHRLLPAAKEFRSLAPAPEGPRELNKVLHPPHVVEPGDVLLVQPAELDAPVRIIPDQPVAPDGTIDLGSYGRPVVAGLTLPVIEAEIQKLIKAKLKPDETVTINVRIVNRNSKVFYVLGEVNAPGAYPITGRETALDAIISAGGLTQKASANNIVMARPTPPCGERILLPICYPQIVQLGDTTTNYQVMAGDRIYVPSQTFCETLMPGGGRRKKDCGPCATPQMLSPMPRPGCGPMGCTPGVQPEAFAPTP